MVRSGPSFAVFLWWYSSSVEEGGGIHFQVNPENHEDTSTDTQLWEQDGKRSKEILWEVEQG